MSTNKTAGLGISWLLCLAMGASALLSCGGAEEAPGRIDGFVSGGSGNTTPSGPPPPACTFGSTAAITLATPIASRVTGVAPLAVFFDATGTTATTTLLPFHELEYRWHFGDIGPGAGTWPTGSRPGVSNRTEATGPVAAHVFETPGTYTVCLTVTDGTNTADGAVTITVLDPDVVFSGTNTICFSNGSSFTGCPNGARLESSSTDFATVLGLAATGKRLLLERGGLWTASASGVVRFTGPGTLGAYPVNGAGARPIVRASGDIRILQLSSGSTPGISDWRIMDIEIDGNGNANSLGVDALGGINQVTLLRLNVHHVHNAFRLNSFFLDGFNNGGSPGHSLWDEMAIVDCVTTNILGVSAALSVYASAKRFVMLGNDMDNSFGGEHTVRLPSIVRGVISNNNLKGQGAGAGGKHAFTLRAAVHGAAGVEGGSDTQYVVVSDNRFFGAPGSQQTVMYGPQATADERVIDVITERNWFTSSSNTQLALLLFAREQTIRNNLFDLTGGAEHIGVRVNGSLNISDRVRVQNNTIYSPDVDTNFIGVMVSAAGVTNVTVRNNLAYAPNDSQRWMFDDPAGVVTAAGNTCDSHRCQTRLTTSPNFVSGTPTLPDDFRVAAPSYAIDGGAAVSVHSDFFRVSRPINGAWDIGAFEQ